MISNCFDESGKVVAHVEWRQVGQSGFDKLQGEYVWLENLWIHEGYRGKGILQRLISDILEKAPDAKFAYFTREKYGKRMSRLFKRESVERVANVLI